MATHPVFTSHEPLPRLPGWRSGGAATWVAVLFVVVSLMSLVLVPWLIDRRLAVIRSEVSDVLEPARVFATQLEVAQLRELAALRGFLLTGERRYLETSDEARLAGESAYDSLSRLTESMDPAVRTPILEMWNLVTDTRIDFQPLLSGEMSRAQALLLFPQVEELFATTQTAAADIRGSIIDLEGRARGRMARASEVEFWTTVFLAVLALAATLVLGLLGVRLRRLVRESERRRRDAVWSRREVDALVAATADGVFSVDHDGRCTSVNPAGMDLLGYTSRDLLGRDLHALMLHSHLDGTPYPRSESPWIRALEGGQTVEWAGENVWRKDGVTFPVRMTARPMVDGRTVKGAVLTLTDMTEVRKAEGALRGAIQARDEVLAVVSHDLRNPVGAIFFSADMLLKVALPEEDKREQLDVIRRSADRMNRLISDLLDIAQIEAGELTLNLAHEEVQTLVSEAISAARPLAEQKKITLACEIEPDVPVAVLDWDRMLQVLSNLLGNAIKFTEEGGRVSVEAWHADGEAVIAVADTGKGIALDDREHLFDRFWRSRRSDREGAGLGLAIVKQVVDGHHGRVWVESEPGVGSTFFVTVRTAAAREEEDMSAEQQPVPESSVDVRLVEVAEAAGSEVVQE